MSAGSRESTRVRQRFAGAGWALEGLALLGLGVSILALVHYWERLPSSIPQHFDVTGEPDAWGSKRRLVALPVLSLAIYIGLSALERYPQYFTYPVPITPHNAQRQYLLARGLVLVLKAGCVWLFTALLWQVLQVGLGTRSQLGTELVVLAIACCGLPPAGYFFLARRMG